MLRERPQIGPLDIEQGRPIRQCIAGVAETSGTIRLSGRIALELRLHRAHRAVDPGDARFDRPSGIRPDETDGHPGEHRGAVVDTNALTEALSARTILAAAVDVTDPEPLPRDHPLLRLDKVIITPPG
jgi:D-isomer specific 2-hydroxyacid dehydrogenase, NAD binding domain